MTFLPILRLKISESPSSCSSFTFCVWPGAKMQLPASLGRSQLSLLFCFYHCPFSTTFTTFCLGDVPASNWVGLSSLPPIDSVLCFLKLSS